jgi:hypothetical protein
MEAIADSVPRVGPEETRCEAQVDNSAAQSATPFEECHARTNIRELQFISRERSCASVRSQRIRKDTMKRALMSAVAIAFLLMLPEPLTAEDLASSIVGTWKLTSFARKEVATGKTAGT